MRGSSCCVPSFALVYYQSQSESALLWLTARDGIGLDSDAGMSLIKYICMEIIHPFIGYAQVAENKITGVKRSFSHQDPTQLLKNLNKGYTNTTLVLSDIDKLIYLSRVSKWWTCWYGVF